MIKIFNSREDIYKIRNKNIRRCPLKKPSIISKGIEIVDRITFKKFLLTSFHIIMVQLS